MNKIINFVPDTTVFGSIVISYALDNLFPIVDIVPAYLEPVGWVFVVAGIVGALYTISVIQKNNRTSYVQDVPPRLIKSGLFAHSRNPFYLSYIVISFGAAVVMGSLSAFAGPLLCIGVLFAIVRYEEQKLQAAFGARYRQYEQTVRRWL